MFKKRVMLQGCDQWEHSLTSDMLTFDNFMYVAEVTGKWKLTGYIVTPYLGVKVSKYLLDVNIDLQLPL